MTDTTGSDDGTRLGRAVAARMRRPGPRLGRLRPSPIGSVASSSVRMASGWGRPVAVRRALAGPAGPIAARSTAAASVAPPHWWAQAAPLRAANLAAEQAAAIPRGLPLMVQRMPEEATRRPGGTPSRLVPETIRVRVNDDVRAAGRMVMSSDGARPRSAHVAAPPGPGAPSPRSRPGNDEGSGRSSSTAPPAGRVTRTPGTPGTTSSPTVPGTAPGTTAAPSPGGRLLRRRALASTVARARAERAAPTTTSARVGAARPTNAPAPESVTSTRDRHFELPVSRRSDGLVRAADPAGPRPTSGAPAPAEVRRSATGGTANPAPAATAPGAPGVAGATSVSAVASGSASTTGGQDTSPASTSLAGYAAAGSAGSGDGATSAQVASGSAAVTAGLASSGLGRGGLPDGAGEARGLPVVVRRTLAGAMRRVLAPALRGTTGSTGDATASLRRSVAPGVAPAARAARLEATREAAIDVPGGARAGSAGGRAAGSVAAAGAPGSGVRASAGPRHATSPTASESTPSASAP
ncbi:MAG TPA: hypothetical protein VNR62_02855, partial [Cellulomonas sp.]|nr:hypothetical protein [Cellulomonas sp.]